MNNTTRNCKGFVTLKLMILLVLIAILFVLMLPSRDNTIRARVEEGLHEADRAKNALLATCQGGHGKAVSKNSEAGFHFTETLYVADIRLNANCATGEMNIHIRMQNTGAEEEPVIVLSNAAGQNPLATGQSEWVCGLAQGNAEHLPENCRGNPNLG